MVLKKLDIRQQRTVIPERQEGYMVGSVIAPVYFLKRVSR